MHPGTRRLCASDFPIRLAPLSLLFVIEGELVLNGDEGTHRLLSGELLALRKPAQACVETLQGRGEALLFQASPEWLARARALFGTDARTTDPSALARETAGSETARRAGKLLLAAHLENGTAPEGSGARAGGMELASRLVELVAIASGLEGSLEQARPPAGARGRSRRASLVRTLEALESAPLEGFSLGVLAAQLGVSERQASRLLRDELGTSFTDYVAALRIERAKKLLATTLEPITDVALETGWQSLSHFNAVFRRRVGSTPTR